MLRKRRGLNRPDEMYLVRDKDWRNVNCRPTVERISGTVSRSSKMTTRMMMTMMTMVIMMMNPGAFHRRSRDGYDCFQK